MAEKPVEPSRRKWIEPVVAVLMALTNLCTASEVTEGHQSY